VSIGGVHSRPSPAWRGVLSEASPGPFGRNRRLTPRGEPPGRPFSRRASRRAMVWGGGPQDPVCSQSIPALLFAGTGAAASDENSIRPSVCGGEGRRRLPSRAIPSAYDETVEAWGIVATENDRADGPPLPLDLVPLRSRPALLSRRSPSAFFCSAYERVTRACRPGGCNRPGDYTPGTFTPPWRNHAPAESQRSEQVPKEHRLGSVRRGLPGRSSPAIFASLGPGRAPAACRRSPAQHSPIRARPPGPSQRPLPLGPKKQISNRKAVSHPPWNLTFAADRDHRPPSCSFTSLNPRPCRRRLSTVREFP